MGRGKRKRENKEVERERERGYREERKRVQGGEKN